MYSSRSSLLGCALITVLKRQQRQGRRPRPLTFAMPACFLRTEAAFTFVRSTPSSVSHHMSTRPSRVGSQQASASSPVEQRQSGDHSPGVANVGVD
eukprot:1838431-Pleurochrysis_carterae.AAC.2